MSPLLLWILELGKTLLAPLWPLLLKMTGKYMDHRLSLGNTIRKTTKIRSVMAELRVLAAADRIGVFRFHNGGVFSDKNPQWKFSCTDEVHGPGVKAIDIDAQAILASRAADIVAHLFTNSDKPCLADCEKACSHKMVVAESPWLMRCQTPCNRKMVIIDVGLMEHGYYKSMLQDQGVHHFVQAALYDSAGFICGFITADFCNFGRDDTVEQNQGSLVPEQAIKKVCEYSQRIEFIMGSIQDEEAQ